jgi:hypothetical protein
LVRQLLEDYCPEDCRPEDYCPWSAFSRHDTGFLIDGWGDILLLLHLDLTDLLNNDPNFVTLRILPGETSPGPAEVDSLRAALKTLRRKVAERIAEICKLKSALYGHFLVSRTETAFAPIVADVALDAMSDVKGEVGRVAKGLELQNTQVRVVADRVTGDVSRNLENAVHAWKVRRKFGQFAIRLITQAGAFDYGLRFNRADSSKMAALYLNRFNNDEHSEPISQIEHIAGIRRRFFHDDQRPEGIGGLLYVSGYARLMEDALSGAQHFVDKIQTTLALETEDTSTMQFAAASR